MKNLITLELLNSFSPCYSPKEIGFTKDLKLTPIEFIEQFGNEVKEKEDILWLLCRKEFMSYRDLRLFAVWCAREALKLDSSPDERSINACDVAEKFANGEASIEELDAARDAARAAAWDAAMDAARDAAMDAAWDAARAAAWAAARDAAWDAAWDAARDAARAAAMDAAMDAAWDAAMDAAMDAARDAAMDAAWDAAWDAQIEQLKTYFK